VEERRNVEALLTLLIVRPAAALSTVISSLWRSPMAEMDTERIKSVTEDSRYAK
jgi:hypothetical protein